jgi:hypothetical protein
MTQEKLRQMILRTATAMRRARFNFGQSDNTFAMVHVAAASLAEYGVPVDFWRNAADGAFADAEARVHTQASEKGGKA